MLPAADILRDLSYEGFLHIVLPSQAKEDWLRDAVLRRSRFIATASVNDSQQLPVEVSVRLSRLFDHELQHHVRLASCALWLRVRPTERPGRVPFEQWYHAFAMRTSRMRCSREGVKHQEGCDAETCFSVYFLLYSFAEYVDIDA